MIVLVGRTARDNDTLSIQLAAPRDFWFHLAGDSGSHVVVRNPDHLDRLPRETKLFAASLAARYSKAKKRGQSGRPPVPCAPKSANPEVGPPVRSGWVATKP